MFRKLLARMKTIEDVVAGVAKVEMVLSPLGKGDKAIHPSKYSPDDGDVAMAEGQSPACKKTLFAEKARPSEASCSDGRNVAEELARAIGDGDCVESEAMVAEMAAALNLSEGGTEHMDVETEVSEDDDGDGDGGGGGGEKQESEKGAPTIGKESLRAHPKVTVKFEPKEPEPKEPKVETKAADLPKRKRGGQPGPRGVDANGKPAPMRYKTLTKTVIDLDPEPDSTSNPKVDKAERRGAHSISVAVHSALHSACPPFCPHSGSNANLSRSMKCA